MPMSLAHCFQIDCAIRLLRVDDELRIRRQLCVVLVRRRSDIRNRAERNDDPGTGLPQRKRRRRPNAQQTVHGFVVLPLLVCAVSTHNVNLYPRQKN